jgi:hypothetical protein
MDFEKTYSRNGAVVREIHRTKLLNRVKNVWYPFKRFAGRMVKVAEVLTMVACVAIAAYQVAGVWTS